MEEKTYPKHELRKMELSTVIPCAKCGIPNGINETVYIDDLSGKVYHVGCQDDRVTETKIYDMTISEGLGVKSQ